MFAAQSVPIARLPLFPVLSRPLLELLQSLMPADWQRPTLVRHNRQNRFHLARDYTEKYHRQQQIREAVDLAEALPTVRGLLEQ